MQTIRIIIRGRVQGVFFRASAKEKAEELQVTGTVRNLPDGNVEVVATGREQDLHDLTEWCKSGPPRAKVSEVEISNLPIRVFPGFSIQKF